MMRWFNKATLPSSPRAYLTEQGFPLSPRVQTRRRLPPARRAARGWARAPGRKEPRDMDVAVTGSSGLIGTALRPVLEAAGHRVLPLVRPGSRTTGVAAD